LGIECSQSANSARKPEPGSTFIDKYGYSLLLCKEYDEGYSMSAPLLVAKQSRPATAATITSKGQITIPIGVRRSLQVGTGDRIEFVEIAEGRFEVIAATRSAMELKGMFGTRKAVSIEDMNAIIAERGAKAR
jgi:AbrB family looped-hinge helix DNA binding protein